MNNSALIQFAQGKIIIYGDEYRNIYSFGKRIGDTIEWGDKTSPDYVQTILEIVPYNREIKPDGVAIYTTKTPMTQVGLEIAQGAVLYKTANEFYAICKKLELLRGLQHSSALADRPIPTETQHQIYELNKSEKRLAEKLGFVCNEGDTYIFYTDAGVRFLIAKSVTTVGHFMNVRPVIRVWDDTGNVADVWITG